VHYWGRSFNDILFKVIYGTGIKNPGKTGHIGELSDHLNVPSRFRVLAMLDTCTARGDKSVPAIGNIMKINAELETYLLNNTTSILGVPLTLENINILRNNYEAYYVCPSVTEHYMKGNTLISSIIRQLPNTSTDKYRQLQSMALRKMRS